MVHHGVPADALVACRASQRNGFNEICRLFAGANAPCGWLRSGCVVVDRTVGFGQPERLLQLVLRQDRGVDAVHAVDGVERAIQVDADCVEKVRVRGGLRILVGLLEDARQEQLAAMDRVGEVGRRWEHDRRGRIYLLDGSVRGL